MDFKEKAVVMTAADMNRIMARMASQIVENNPDLSNVLLVGIHRRGVPLAEKLASKIKEMDSVAIATGTLDITLYRDDLSTVAEQPIVNSTQLPANITGKTIILVRTDDARDVAIDTRIYLQGLEVGRVVEINPQPDRAKPKFFSNCCTFH